MPTQGEGPQTQTAKGSFDWGTREGDGRRQWLGGGVEVVQQGDACFQRFEGEAWRRSLPRSRRAVSARSISSATRTVSSSCSGRCRQDLREVGTEELRGIPTTHWRGTLRVGEDEGTVEMWVDVDKVVRKRIQQDPGVRTVREYLDFGVDVDVDTPDEYEEAKGE